MNTIWVILNETKDAVVAVFETEDADSKPHWDLFFQHRPGCVFCGRVEKTMYSFHSTSEKMKWYYNYFYWADMSRWGYKDPGGIAWSAAMALPEPIKMLELLRGK